MKYLLDTCVVSELSKKHPSESVLRWFESVEEDDLLVSSVTIGELRKGIEMLADDDARRLVLEAWYNSVVSSFGHRIIQYDKDIAVEWGRIVGRAMREGNARSPLDMQIAATAFKFGMTLVTRNIRDMQGVGVRLLNPFGQSST